MQWFNTLGFSMPYGVNMADFILDVASGAPQFWNLVLILQEVPVLLASGACQLSPLQQQAVST